MKELVQTAAIGSEAVKSCEAQAADAESEDLGTVDATEVAYWWLVGRE